MRENQSAPFTMDDDALIAAVELVGRSGARQFEIGYLHDDVPVDDAGWWARALYRGDRIIEENHRGPVEAAEALARRVLTGARCTHCKGLIALSDRAAVFYPKAHMADGSTFTEEEARAVPQCRWRRIGDRWERGCAGDPRRSSKPGRRQAAKKRGRR